MKHYIVPAAAALFFGVNVFAGSPAAPYNNSSIDARLNVTVKEGTQVVHFVRDNADPNVITKAYVVKHVDPYELRSYLRGVVQTRKVNGDNTNIEAVRYTDGTSVLLISAEDYRFDDTPNAQGFDSIVRDLDKPKLVSSSGRQTYVYAPKNLSSSDLVYMISEVGLYSKDTIMNNVGGTDVVAEDPGLNLLFFCTAPFSRRTIEQLLATYDRPTPTANVKVTVYELYAENDTKLGMDFQAWKNNDGADFFRGGGRFSRNHNGAELVNGRGWNDTSYFQFNPKWNTKYIDFLTSKGKAKVLHTSQFILGNNAPASISKMTQVFVAKAKKLKNDDTAFSNDYAIVDVKAGEVLGKDSHGRIISINKDAQISVLKMEKDGSPEYILRSPTIPRIRFTCRGKNIGNRAILAFISDKLEAALVKNTVGDYQRGKAIETEPSNQFGFHLQMIPSINAKATTLNVKISNSSLIGYTSDGSPRIQKGAEINTNFMISNEGTKLVIGGIEKRSVVSVSGGIPILKDLPLLGWIFSTETEATKRSQLLVVAEVVPEKKVENYKSVFDGIQKKLQKAGVSNTYGYRQFLLDPERLK